MAKAISPPLTNANLSFVTSSTILTTRLYTLSEISSVSSHLASITTLDSRIGEKDGEETRRRMTSEIPTCSGGVCSRSNANCRTTRLDGYIRCAVITKAEGEVDERAGTGLVRTKGWRLTVRLDFEGCQWKIVTVRGGANNAPEI